VSLTGQEGDEARQSPEGLNRVVAAVRAGRGRPALFAHRGASALAPENTIEAARLAHALGAEAWELDVRLTRDGVPVVIHDESLARTTDVARRFRGDPRGTWGYRVADFDLDEVRTLDAGSWFVDATGRPRSAAWFGTLGALGGPEVARYTSGEVRVPTLRECLELTARLGWLVNVEVKPSHDPDARLVAAVVAVVGEVGVADRVLLSSFDHGDVARAGGAAAGLATGVLTVSPLHQPARYVRELVGADSYHPSAEALGASGHGPDLPPRGERLRADDLRALDRAGIPVLSFTVNDARPGGLARRLADVGVSGLFTDDPGGLLRLFERAV
jgi:glycerophosphoryl diester phosphodiesterase